jgi:hypothetical protein
LTNGGVLRIVPEDASCYFGGGLHFISSDQFFKQGAP